MNTTEKLLKKKKTLQEEIIILKEKMNFELQKQQKLNNEKTKLEQQMQKENELNQPFNREVAIPKIPSLINYGSSYSDSKKINNESININVNINNFSFIDSLFRKVI